MSDWVDVARVEDFPPGTYRVVDVDDVLVAVFNVDGSFHAIEDVCTHDGERLTGGAFRGDEVVCPRHGARFCVRTGEPQCPPAYEPTAVFPTRVEGGTVQVRDPRWD